jgi:hypothetical protein
VKVIDHDIIASRLPKDFLCDFKNSHGLEAGQYLDKWNSYAVIRSLNKLQLKNYPILEQSFQ